MTVARASLSAGTGPPVLCCIHGVAGHAGVWIRQLEALADRARVIALDLPGHGAAGGKGAVTILEYVDAVRTSLDGLGVDRFIAVGHSMGGAIAQALALAHPERLAGLILVGTGARLRVLPRLFAELERDYAAGARLLIELCLAGDAAPELFESLYRQTLRVPPEVTIGDFRACDAFDVMPQVAGIAVRTLIVCGTEDRLTPPKYAAFLHDHIRGARLALIPGAGHYVQLERPDETSAAIREFLSLIPPERGGT